MTGLETLIVFVLGFLPALIFWILLIAYVTNKIYDAIERDKQLMDEYTFDCYGYAHKKDEINDCSCKDELNEFSFSITGCKDEIVNKRDEYLKRDSDYRDAKFKYAEDKLSDYLNTDGAVERFQFIFGSINSFERKKELWKRHLEDLRAIYERDFDNL